MLDLKSSVQQLLNPCKIASSKRVATYAQAEAATYTSNQEIRFTLPQDSMDLSESYINMNVDLLETDAEVPSILLIDSVTAPGVYPLYDAGTFQIRYNGKPSIVLDWDSTAQEVQDAVFNIMTVKGTDLDIIVADAAAVAPYTTGVNTVAAGVKIVISGFKYDNLPDVYGWEIVNSSLTLATAFIPSYLSELQVGDYAYPRLEPGNPLVSAVRIDIDGETIMNLNQVDVLGQIVHYMQPNSDRYYSFETGAEANSGLYLPGEFRVIVNLTDYMPIFRKIWPLKHIGRNFRVYLTLNQPHKCLVWKSDGADYTVSNVEFHYNRINFSKSEHQLINQALEANQLIIPYVTYSNYSTSLPIGTSNIDIPFTPSCSAMLGMIAVMQPQDFISDPTNNRKTSTFLKNKLFSARMKANNQYHPLDLIKSIQQDKNDVTEYISEFINVAPYVLGDMTRDMRLFFNYRGNYPEDTVYIPEWDHDFNPTFAIGISTSATGEGNFGHICKPGQGYAGLNLSRAVDVRLELRGLELQETSLVQIYSIEQNYLVFGNGFFQRIR